MARHDWDVSGSECSKTRHARRVCRVSGGYGLSDPAGPGPSLRRGSGPGKRDSQVWVWVVWVGGLGV